MKVLITGASGFIGLHLSRHLLALGHEVTAVIRSVETASSKNVSATHTAVLTDITAITSAQLVGIDVVIHLAGVAHDYGVSKSEFERVNVEGTRHLAHCCVEASVKKLVFISSVKAIAENSKGPLQTDVYPAPVDDYGKSKLSAENLLLALSDAGLSDSEDATRGYSIPDSPTVNNPGRDKQGIEILIIRIPLVYGEGVKGNFQSLVKLVRSGIPLLFKEIKNKRSYMGIQNLCDFLANCVHRDTASHSSAGSVVSVRKNLSTGIYHIADEPSVSFASLVENIALAVGKTPENYRIPKSLIVLAGSLVLGRRRAASLFGDLELDTAETFRTADWRPPYDLQRGLDVMLRPPGSGEASWYGNLSRKAD